MEASFTVFKVAEETDDAKRVALAKAEVTPDAHERPIGERD